MNSKGHFYVSVVKSIIRILSCVGTIIFSNVRLLGVGFLLAELLGVVEELVDYR